ncbi:HET-domain-containing protein, partial [Acephala macrosclerotiorum]
DGFEMPIGTNLWEALYYLAPTCGARVLWIDAICINQESDVERNHQVAQMGRIYSTTETVVVWLGSPTKESQALFQLLGNHQWSDFQNSPTLPKQSLEYLILLCQKEYWARLWIIQEVI